MQDNDLISRKALGISRCNPDAFNNRAYGEGWNACIAIIEAAPAVDAARVRHGRWIPKVIHMNTPDYYACSVCGHEVDEEFTSAIPVPYVYKFCPNCGAKMDGGETH